MSNILSSIAGKDIHAHELVRQSSAALVIKLLGIASSYVFVLLITRSYGPVMMGIFSIAFTLTNICVSVGRLGMDTALLKFIPEYIHQERWDMIRQIYRTSLRTILLFSACLSVLVFLGAPLISKAIFHKEYLVPYFRIASLAIVPSALIMLNAQSLRSLKKITGFSFFMHISNFLFASLCLGMILLFGKPASAPLVAYIVAVCLGAVLSYLVLNRNFRFSQDSETPGISLKTILSYSMPLLFSDSMIVLMQWTDTIILGIYRPEAEVGIYNVAFKISTAVTISLFAVLSISVPKVSEFIAKNDRKGLQDFINQSTKLMFWTAIPILMILLAFPSFLLGIFGKPFQDAVSVLIILSLGQFLSVISGCCAMVIVLAGKQKIFQFIMIGAAFLNITLNFFLIPSFGAIGAALATVCGTAFWICSTTLYLKLHMNINTIYLPGFRRLPDTSQ